MSSIFPTDPAQDAAVVTPSDTADQGLVRGLFVGGAGNVSLVTAIGNTVVFTGVLAGSILPVRCTKVRSTGTTATNIVALY
tara:strand:- start:740 stop:982 length:243 start_codon:yes stop_codon:yes gene_type:complete